MKRYSLQRNKPDEGIALHYMLGTDSENPCSKFSDADTFSLLESEAENRKCDSTVREGLKAPETVFTVADATQWAALIRTSAIVKDSPFRGGEAPPNGQNT